MTLRFPQGKTWRLLPGSDDSKLDGVERRRGVLGRAENSEKREEKSLKCMLGTDGGMSCCCAERYSQDPSKKKQVASFMFCKSIDLMMTMLIMMIIIIIMSVTIAVAVVVIIVVIHT